MRNEEVRAQNKRVSAFRLKREVRGTHRDQTWKDTHRGARALQPHIPTLSSTLSSLVALSVSAGLPLPSPPLGQCGACTCRSRAGLQGFQQQPTLFVQVWAEGGGVSRSLGLALDFLTKEAGGSALSFPLPGENSLLPYIHKYIRGTDKSSLFRNKPRRLAGSPWPC